jgi:hypothetical protein
VLPQRPAARNRSAIVVTNAQHPAGIRGAGVWGNTIEPFSSGSATTMHTYANINYLQGTGCRIYSKIPAVQQRMMKLHDMQLTLKFLLRCSSSSKIAAMLPHLQTQHSTQHKRRGNNRRE